MIHQFKNFLDGETFAQIEWEGYSSFAPSSSPVYLQVFNYNTNVWETIDSETEVGANINFELYYKINDPTNYKDASNVISCRVWQLGE